MPCNAFPYVIVLVVVVWIASCCTSFAFNKNDYSKEFGYSTRAVQEDQDSDNGTSPQGLMNKKQPTLHIDDSEIERGDENESPSQRNHDLLLPKKHDNLSSDSNRRDKLLSHKAD